ncbi:hypothetical protein K2173_012636 [Erythroxylum novogranatense]|uniref:Leucine-rich repeat-containing N-terminal plant-type domain-containing protein n=1 Tax=Erythroxylum novogranatense TaxID=1862640 RepID=A0AAV8TLG4_9ROSI|nr:hypothetical protein K2173_012636 [Erythroxylum novogranatense]
MGSFCLYSKTLVQTLVVLLPFLAGVSCQIIGNPLTPILSPLLPPIIPEILNFLDQRLTILLPIIQAFKNTITFDPLNVTQTWVGPNICNYTGFYCDHPPDNQSATALAAIDFNGFQLTAPSLDGFIDQLPDLAIFHANSNNFFGAIPSKTAKLPFLYELDISNNGFSGNFPMEILAITGLSFLDIRYNSFTGSVPPQVFTQNLDVLFLNNNNFMQKLPETLGSSPVRYLTFANNKFTGPLPKSILNASSTLTEILLLNNMLSGCLPYELGLLRQLVLFDASNNQLTGPLPCSLGCLANIQQLNLAQNLLFGQVPEKNCIRDLPDQRPVQECTAFSLTVGVVPTQHHLPFFLARVLLLQIIMGWDQREIW